MDYCTNLIKLHYSTRNAVYRHDAYITYPKLSKLKRPSGVIAVYHNITCVPVENHVSKLSGIFVFLAPLMVKFVSA